MNRNTHVIVIALLVAFAASIGQATSFNSFYGEAVYSGHFGFSSFGKYTIGLRDGNTDRYAFASVAFADTTGSQLPLAYSTDSLNLGVGLRHWILDRQAFVMAEVFHTMMGTDSGNTDIKAGGVGFWGSPDPGRIADTYGELIYTGSTEVLTLNLIHRRGRNLSLDNSSDRLGVYGVGQLVLSTSGTLNADNNNRIEVGAGMRYQMGAHLTGSVEVRVGNFFASGADIDDPVFINPVISIIGAF